MIQFNISFSDWFLAILGADILGIISYLGEINDKSKKV